MAKKPLIPFGTFPAHWGLAGKSRLKAKAEYELGGYGYDYELRISEIDMEDTPEGKLQFEQDKIAIAFKHGRISKEEMERQFADIIQDETARRISHLRLDEKYNKITDFKAHAKEMSTLLDEPWVDVLKLEIDPRDPVKSGGSFHLDWNPQFVKQLKSNGYIGINDDMIVAQWFDALCQVIARENDIPIADATDETKVKRKPGRGKGKVDYS